MSATGIRLERLQLECTSAAEGISFKKEQEMETTRRTVSSEEIEETIELLPNLFWQSGCGRN
jgi:hypothetical protein